MTNLMPSPLQLLQLVLVCIPAHWIAVMAVHKSASEKIALERWLRGYKEVWALPRADWVLVSWGKSGRTWLRVMLSQYYKLRFNLSGNPLLGFRNLQRHNKAIPAVFFTHNNYLKDYTGCSESLEYFYHKKVVFLARDPRDVVVSQYFHWKYRMRRSKKIINQYPRGDIDIFDFALHERQGLDRVIDFMNRWARLTPGIKDSRIVRYEDLRREPIQQLISILDFTGMPNTEELVSQAVDYGELSKMKKRESDGYRPKLLSAILGLPNRVRPGNPDNQDSYKARKGKVGGFLDYFNAGQLAQINERMMRLHPAYGYNPDGSLSPLGSFRL